MGHWKESLEGKQMCLKAVLDSSGFIFLRFSVDTLLQGDRLRSYTCSDICRYSKGDMNKNLDSDLNVISGTEMFLFLS